MIHQGKKRTAAEEEQREDELLGEEAEKRLADPSEVEEDAEKVLRELGL